METGTATGPDLVMGRRAFTKALAGGALALTWGMPPRLGAWRARVPTTLVTRAAHSARRVGWRQLGILNGAFPSTANFRESDILYNPEDRMYYVFSTEGDGNPLPPTPIAASTAANPTTITAPGHYLKVGMQLYISGHLNNSDDKPSALNNRGAHHYYQVSAVNVGGDPAAFQVVSAAHGWPVASKGGYDGLLNYLPDPHIAMRRASSPEGIALASGEDYVEAICSGIWYPTVIKEGEWSSSSWHLWGTKGAHNIGHLVLKGDRPGPAVWTKGATLGAPLLLGDISVRRNPADGYWYAVGLYRDSNTDMRIYRSKDILSDDLWEPVGAVFANGRPSWATASTPDPNICFVDGRAYVLFAGGKVVGQWNTGIVEVNMTTGMAKGPAVILLEYGTYPIWMNSVLSDLVFVPSGHDGVDRIFAFGSVPYHSGQSAVWGCLDLDD